jgi:hypothetical protein
MTTGADLAHVRKVTVLYSEKRHVTALQTGHALNGRFAQPVHPANPSREGLPNNALAVIVVRHRKTGDAVQCMVAETWRLILRNGRRGSKGVLRGDDEGGGLDCGCAAKRPFCCDIATCGEAA